MMINVLSVLIFLCSVFVLYADTGVTSQPVTAVEGDDVTLQCPLAPGVDLSAHTVDVSRDDLDVSGNDVHVYQSGQDLPDAQMAQYKKRTTLSREDLTKGNMTLTLSSVKLSDSGRYKVYVPKLDVSCVIDLSVVPSTTKPPVEGVTETDDRDQRIRSKRNDSSTTPAEGLNKSDSADGGNRRTVGAVIVAAVFIIFCVFTALILNGKKIKNRMRMIRGRRAQEGNVTNGTELNPLRATTQNDLNHNGPRNNVQVV